jgi:TPR repeat protein
MWRILLTILLAVAAPARATAVSAGVMTPLDAGMAAYAGGDYCGARAQLRPLADRGSAIAETVLGVMAAKGQGRAADPAVAVGWWLRAANRGYAPAQLALAKALASGRGVGADPRRAWVWARLAADAGAGTGVAVEAGSLADGLARRFSAPTLAELKAERAAWRSWP